jgi:transposase-like protein
VRENGRWIYFYGAQPLFQHPENDRCSFRMFTAQLICLGACRQVDIVRAFGVAKNSVIRSVTKYRAGGVNAFFAPRATRGASVLTPEVTAQAQQLLGAGWSAKEVAEQLGLKPDTLRKAIQHGQLTKPCSLEPAESVPGKAPAPQPPTATDKSTRAVEDAAAVMGTACTRPDQRVLAAFGLLNGAPTRFETCRDVSFGGVLCALPALAENGLFRHIHDCLKQVRGYYSTLHVIVLLAHMALCRIKAVEQLQYQPPGELGKLLGLDRVPEVRCLRYKLAALSLDDGPKKWAGLLSRDWLEAAPELAGALYVDGHVRHIMAARPRCPNAMSPDSDCACGGPPTTGSTTPWASHSSRSNGRSTTGFSRRCAATSCRVCSRMFPANRVPRSSRPTAIARGS